MLSCANRPGVRCDDESDDKGSDCGTAFAYPYFISFYMLCSFLVSFSHQLFNIFTLNQLVWRWLTCLWPWLWTILTIWRVTGLSWGPITWMSLFAFGLNTTRTQSELNSVFFFLQIFYLYPSVLMVFFQGAHQTFGCSNVTPTDFTATWFW